VRGPGFVYINLLVIGCVEIVYVSECPLGQNIKFIMPIVEIASLNSMGLNLHQQDFSVAILEETSLKSHRRRFSGFLKKHTGTIVHVGNPVIIEDKNNLFFAGEIIDWEFEPVEILYLPMASGVNAVFKGGANQLVRFKFLNQFKYDIDLLLRTAIEKSPVKKCCFFTDYYFGPERATIEKIRTVTSLWKKHDLEGLVFNTMYELNTM
jgi:hypothetical protein